MLFRSLIVDARVAAKVKHLLPGLRATVRDAVEIGIPVPCLMASLGYLESLRSASLPTNLIQAQRDFFGAHGYERVDVEGAFHSKWDEA